MGSFYYNILSVIALCGIVGFLLDHRMHARNRQLNRYRFGYAAACVAVVLGSVALFDVATALAAGRLSVSGLFTTILGTFAAVGIARRRRFGWLCLISLIGTTGSVVALLIGTASTTGGVTIALLTVVLIASHIPYLKRRWPEFKRLGASRAEGEATLATPEVPSSLSAVALRDEHQSNTHESTGEVRLAKSG